MEGYTPDQAARLLSVLTDRDAESAAERIDLLACLDAMDPRERFLVLAIALHGYSKVEVARLLHCDETTVGRQFSAALCRLTLALNGEDETSVSGRARPQS